MRRIVFYSWQSDSPNACNRGFIQKALEKAARTITDDDSVMVEPAVDRDTQNVPGSPDIASTIFAKISAADIFVADVSIVSRCDGARPTPNPNVLVELGYALRAFGHERVVLVFNEAFGKLEELPFDLRSRRAITYNMPEATSERAPERKRLTGHLEAALRAALGGMPHEEGNEETESIPAVSAIESVQPNRVITLRDELGKILQEIDASEPPKYRDGGRVDELIDGIGKTQEAVGRFSKISEVSAVMEDETACLEIMRWFGKIFERYNLPEGFSGTFYRADFDYFKFIGHEMVVTLVAFLMRERRWDLLKSALDEPIPMLVPHDGPGSVRWDFASQHLELLIQESEKRQLISLHGALLNERHSDEGGLGVIMPMRDFAGADFFLFLAARKLEGETGRERRRPWRAWGCVYMTQLPMFVRTATSPQAAKQIAEALGVADVGELVLLLSWESTEITTSAILKQVESQLPRAIHDHSHV